MYLYHVICCSEVLINYQREIIIVSAYRENSWEIYRRKYFTMFTDWTLPHWVPIGILRLISVWPVPNSKHAWGLPVAYTRPLNSYNENIFSKCHWNKIFWSPSLKKTFQTQTKMDGFWIMHNLVVWDNIIGIQDSRPISMLQSLCYNFQ